MSSPQLYWRKFYRTGKTRFEDIAADKAFADKNFVDFFGQEWLPQNPQALSLDSMLRPFYDQHNTNDQTIQFKVFAVSDGSVVASDSDNQKWLQQDVRFIALVAGSNTESDPASFFSGTFDGHTDKGQPTAKKWTLCIVGSSNLTSNRAFLQVASWDGKVFRYYERDRPNGNSKNPPTWIFMGDSSMAFGEQSYLGPFNGHVNGSLVMKERKHPWMHWLAGPNNFANNVDSTILNQFSNVIYLNDPDEQTHNMGLKGSISLSKVAPADDLQQLIETGIEAWRKVRQKTDFFDENNKPRQSVKNVKRWFAHILLTTTVNIVPARDATDRRDVDYIFPQAHFYNTELFGSSLTQPIQPVVDQEIGFKKLPYERAVDAIGLSLVQSYPEDPADYPDPAKHPKVENAVIIGGGEDPDVEYFVVVPGEGQNIEFTILEPSYEDVQGSIGLLGLKKAPSFISKECIYAMLMVDPWNPIYSWKRGVLLQYVPDTTELPGPYDPKATPPQKYNLEDAIEAAVRDSARYKNEPNSPEREFIANLEGVRKGTLNFGEKMTQYLNNVVARLQDPEKVNDAMTDYLKLAESRRRIYRPVPLDEFDLTLPWATKYNSDVPLEMNSDGTVQPIARRGQKFFYEWITSLANDDPQMIPRPDKDDPSDSGSKDFCAFGIDSTTAIKTAATLSCQSTASAVAALRGKCPALSKRRAAKARSIQADSNQDLPTPTWDDDVSGLFTQPYWITPEEQSKAVGRSWVGAMRKYGAPIPPWDSNASTLGLDNYDQVKLQAVTIYQHVASRSMPITSNPDHYWPESALELLRAWVNQGCRKTKADKIIRPPKLLPRATSPILRTRKDVRELTAAELSLYRSKLSEVLEVESLRSKWQELGEIHAWWCLHYQEATFFWHRAYLHYVETLLGVPIPYWNGFAADAAEPDSEFAGIPSIFLEDTYVHPNGTTLPNPLKYALSYQGRSKSDPNLPNPQRNPILTKGRPAQAGADRDKWDAHINLFKTYHAQIRKAMQQTTFSLPQYNPTDKIHAEAAWTALPAFLAEMPDEDYKVAWSTFDGHFEQAHDNFHGWVGGLTGEMSDNTYTAFDPIFLSYHCNMDRLFEVYLRANPGTRLSADFPLKPFINKGTDIDLMNPNNWAYTTTGEMSRPVQALGYAYAPPASPDVFQLDKPKLRAPPPTGGASVKLVSVKPQSTSSLKSDKDISINFKPTILFEDVVCTEKSYEIDVFIKGAKSDEADPVKNPDFVGRLFRFGMGTPPDGAPMQNKSRCLKDATTRTIDAEGLAERIAKEGWTQVVKELDGTDTGKLLTQEEWKAMRGFQGKLVWLAKS